ncbi:MAG: methylated-DNA--[protein]-cysteine S-methyltransferase [Chloroflexi bacterium]|nr:methylated-DNA--[protein]-cysteine S-methyltransferase [Chloroflexota bacterium]
MPPSHHPPVAPTNLAAAVIETAWGWVGLVARPDALLYAGYPLEEQGRAWEDLYGRFGPGMALEDDPEGLLALAEDHFRAYFAGERVSVDDLPVTLEGTPFEVKVWEATRRIPWGKTVTYGDLGYEVQHPMSARGVGRAMSRNPAGLLAPCCRVIAAGGRLGGFGGREDRKERLLALEGVQLRPHLRTPRLPRIP